MELAHQVLDHHPINEARRAQGKLPANGVWFWAEGSAVALDSFWDKYHKTGTVISAVPLCFGIARLSGLDIREVEGATGEPVSYTHLDVYKRQWFSVSCS